MLVDSVDIATVGVIRYARSLNPQSLTAVHFVIDDLRAKTIFAEWAKNKGLSDVELTLLLPRRSYSFFLGRILHDRTAEAIAAPISQLPGVVATIVPFDVEKIISGNLVTRPAETKIESPVKITESKKYTAKKDVMVSMPGPVSHYSEKMLPIGNAKWRERAHVRGRVTSIMSAPSGSPSGVDNNCRGHGRRVWGKSDNNESFIRNTVLTFIPLLNLNA